MPTKKIRNGLFAATVEPQTLQETDSLRGDIPRSRWIERALKMYNATKKKEEGKEEEQNKGVRGSQEATNHRETPAATPTPTPKTDPLLYKGGFRR
jgi:hypothetical protein